MSERNTAVTHSPNILQNRITRSWQRPGNCPAFDASSSVTKQSSSAWWLGLPLFTRLSAVRLTLRRAAARSVT